MIPIETLDVAVYEVPTDGPEADATLSWSSTTMVVVVARAAGLEGLGYTYAGRSSATLIRSTLADLVVGRDAESVGAIWEAMVRAIRNLGRPGVASTAIAAVDLALWDLKARLLGVTLASLLGAVRDAVPIYGSGGFTNYPEPRLTTQLAGWVHDDGIPRVKMKVGDDRGRSSERDVERTQLVRAAIGDGCELYVDANGGYSRKVAARQARAFSEAGVTWFEEPVSSDDLRGLHEIRQSVDIDVAAGEYGYDLAYFERMCEAGAVDVLQADVTRCGGITELLRVAAVAAAHGLDLSCHCAPAVHLHPACAILNLRHLEYFHDHVQIETALLDGVARPVDGELRPDPAAPGTGLALREADAARYLVDETEHR